jgi:putative endonuclease
MNKTQNKGIGAKGEGEAEKYLKSLGYKILRRNYRLFCGEIDILAQDSKDIVIVEVKSVRGTGFGSAQELVRYKKQNKLKLLAKTLEQQYPDKTIRIDVVGIEYNWRNEVKIDHLKNAVN